MVMHITLVTRIVYLDASDTGPGCGGYRPRNCTWAMNGQRPRPYLAGAKGGIEVLH